MEIEVSRIRTDGGTQPRAELDLFVIEDYAQAMRDGAEFPPVVVFYDGQEYWLADGFHRLSAAQKAERSEIAADVRQGTRREAVLFSVGANASHGLRRTNADKRRSVLTLLQDEEWQGWSDHEIARRCGVSQPFVTKLRPAVSDNGYQITRKAQRNGTTYSLCAAGINALPRASKAEQIAPEVRQIIRETPAADNREDILRLARLEAPQQILIAEKVATGEARSVREAERVVLAERRQEERRLGLEIGATDPNARFQPHHCSVAELRDRVPAGSLDAIITDPPYPYSFIETYSDLAVFAAHALKPGGSLLAMCGQSYLPEIIQRLGEHLRYHWALAYLTPGGQSAQVFPRKVNPFWKPVLWFTKGDYAGEWHGDTLTSDVNDNDKDFHEWGQSESGTVRLVEGWSKPGDLICDPFLGGGTTAAVALRLGRRVIGADIDESALAKTLERVGGLA